MKQIDGTVTEPARNIKITGRYDVVVVGGGVAGVAAAVAASRCGAKTLLVEKEYALGGLATLGLVVAYLPLCDGRGQQVSFALAEELLLLTTRDGSATVPQCWLKNGDQAKRASERYFLHFNPASAILLLEEFICDNGVDLLYDTRFSTVIKSNGRIEAAVFENKSGRIAIECGSIVDATGDADICVAAGEQTISLDTNTAGGWYYATSDKGLELFKLYKPFDPEGKVVPENGGKGYSGSDGRSVTEHMLDSRAMIRQHVAGIRSKRGDETIWPFLIPTFAGFRMTRRLKGRTDFLASDREIYADSIGLIGDWRESGPVYSIPFSALAAVSTSNLVTAGRCISADGYGWDQSRSIPACVVTGQAAGTAAAFSDTPALIDTGKLQQELGNQGCKLRLDELNSNTGPE
ncbi:MAG: FAD-dependent oxidoreductase [Phycisphaerae bacterium]|nr:FAD-dependent oxidoreductase [Phycisphaerae bacterium]